METRRTQHYKLNKANKQHIFICGAFLVSTGLVMMANSTVVHADVATGTINGGDVQTTQTVKNTTDTLNTPTTNTSSADSAEADDAAAADSESTDETNASASEVSAPTNDTSGADAEASQDTKTVEADNAETTPVDTNSAAVDKTLQDEKVEVKKDVKTTEVEGTDTDSAPVDKTLQSEKVKVKEAKIEQDNTESAADKTLKDAKSDAGKLVDDQSHNYDKFIDGESKTITMDSGATVKINNDIINANNSTNLTLSGTAQAGETYTILIPMAYADKRKNIPTLPPANGDTSILQYKDADGHEYFEITYKFTKRADFVQRINLIRNTSVYLDDILTNSTNDNYYRPYDLVSGKVKVIHDTEVKDLDIKYQLPMVFRGADGYLSLKDNEDNIVPNGTDIDISIPIDTDFTYQSEDIFGKSSINIPDFSFDLTDSEGRNIADWVKISSDTGKITSQNGDESTFDISLEPQDNNSVKVNIKNVAPITFTRWNVNKHLVANVPLNIHVPKSAFPSSNSKVKLNVSDVNVKGIVGNSNSQFNAKDSGLAFEVTPALDTFDAQIKYHENKTYQNIDAGQYTTDSGGFKSDSQSITSELINGQIYKAGYKVDGFSNFVNKDLKNIHYALDIPDGISIYSINYGGGQLKNTPDSLVLTLSDGTKVNLTKDQLQGKSSVSLRHNISHNGYYINSSASISRVEAFYSTVLGKSDFGVTSSKDNNGYKIESTYASGEPVKNADKLYFKAQVYSDDSANKISPTDVTLCEVYIKDFEQGVNQQVISHQISGQAGNGDAGSMAYQIADSSTSAFRPNLEHPIAYIKVPVSTVVDDLSQITVKERADSTSFGAKLTPKLISVVKVGDTDFIKVDLSNYDLLRRGFTITVPYGNAIDAQPGAEHSPFLVVADNLSGKNVKEVDHFLSDPDAKTDAAMRALIAQEGINTVKTSYTGTGSRRSAQWVIAQGIGMSSSTMVSDNQSAGVKTSGEQSLNKDNPDTFNIYGSIINSTSQKINGAVEVVNLPDTADGKSGFTPVMDGSAKLIILSGEDGNVAADPGKVDAINKSAKLLYRLSAMDLKNAQSKFDQNDGTWLTYDQITDWSKVKSVAVSLVGKEIPSYTTLRLEIPVKDSHIYDHVNQTVYVSSAIFSQDADHDSSLPTLTIEPASRNSAKLTVVGHSTIKTLVHYKDNDGNDHYVELSGHTKTYQDGVDTMYRTDFLQSDADLTKNDKLPDGLAIDYAHPTIQNSEKKYLNNYPNNPAEFGKLVKYDFDGDVVVFEAAPLIPIEGTAQIITRTIHYQYADGRKAAKDVVQTSKELTDHGTRNPFTGEEKWTSIDSDNLGEVLSPPIPGYTPDKAKVPEITVTSSSDKNITVTVTYNANKQKLDVTFIDDTTSQTIQTVTREGVSDASAKYNTSDDIERYKGKGYALVSDNTNGANLVFDHNDKDDQHYVVHLKHTTSEVSRKDTINETINYVYENGKTAADSYHADPIIFTQTGIKDNVTGDIAWNKIPSQTFAKHESPRIAGYTADTPIMDTQVVNFGDKDIVKTVTYKANEQKLEVVFIDDTIKDPTKRVLKTVTETGPSDSNVKYTTKTDIADYVAKHYVLVSDTTEGKALVFDHDDIALQHYEVHLKHDIEKATDTKTVKRTIHYQYTDGTQASPDVVQTATLTRNGEKDLVTNETTWGDWSGNQTLGRVVSPTITGYTANPSEVVETEVGPTSEDMEVTVVYSKNSEPTPPTQPTEGPTEPTEPTQPGPTDEPIQPTEPEQPVHPEEPEQPTQPAHPEPNDQPIHSNKVDESTGPVHPEDVDEPDKTTQTGVPVKAQKELNTSTENESNENKLPQTGESKNHSVLAGFFMGLASLITMFGFGKKRKDDKESN